MLKPFPTLALAALLGGSVTVPFPGDSASGATILTLFNTGVDANGIAVTDNTPDPHWTLVEPSPVTGVPLAATSTGGFPIPPWLPDSIDSAWAGTLREDALGPGSNTNIGVNADYHYQTTFSLAGLIPSTAAIAGRFAQDNFLVDVLVNGQSTGISDNVNSFTTWTNFAFDPAAIANLTPGDNTVTFIVRSAQADGGDDYTSLRVEWLTRTADAIPEPGSGILALIGASALLGRRRRA